MLLRTMFLLELLPFHSRTLPFAMSCPSVITATGTVIKTKEEESYITKGMEDIASAYSLASI